MPTRSIGPNILNFNGDLWKIGLPVSYRVLVNPLFSVACSLKLTTSFTFITINSTKMSNLLTAYCMKTKEKNVPMQDAVITKTSRGGYMAQGHDGKGNKMTTMLSEANAVKAVADGVAKKGWD
jgi:hypothetical protein